MLIVRGMLADCGVTRGSRCTRVGSNNAVGGFVVVPAAAEDALSLSDKAVGAGGSGNSDNRIEGGYNGGCLDCLCKISFVKYP
jgi:hypothetical protein